VAVAAPAFNPNLIWLNAGIDKALINNNVITFFIIFKFN